MQLEEVVHVRQDLLGLLRVDGLVLHLGTARRARFSEQNTLENTDSNSASNTLQYTSAAKRGTTKRALVPTN